MPRAGIRGLTHAVELGPSDAGELLMDSNCLPVSLPVASLILPRCVYLPHVPPAARVLAEEIAESRVALASLPAGVPEHLLQALDTLSADLLRGEASLHWQPAVQLVENAVTASGALIKATCQASLDHRGALLKVIAPIMETGFGARDPVCGGCPRSGCRWTEAKSFHELCRQLGQEQIALRRARYCYAQLTRVLSLLEGDDEAVGSRGVVGEAAPESEVTRVAGFRELMLTLRALLLPLLEHAPCPSLRHISLNLLLKMGVPFAKALAFRAFAAAPNQDLQQVVQCLALDEYPLMAAECAALPAIGPATGKVLTAGTVRRRLNLAIHHILRNM